MLFYFMPLVVSWILCVLHSSNTIKFSKSFYFFGFLFLGLVGGVRYQIGYDWEVYDGYFNSIDTTVDPLSAYLTNNFYPSFEVGYFFLNYYTKLIGGEYSTIFFLSSVFCSTAAYRLTSKFEGNKWYILAIYICFNFTTLHFAQVRQALSLGFVLLGCRAYLDTGNKIKAIFISSLSLFFQISSVLYCLIIIFSMYRNINIIRLSLFTFFICLLGLCCGGLDAITSGILNILPLSFANKALLYINPIEGVSFNSHHLIFKLCMSIYIVFFIIHVSCMKNKIFNAQKNYQYNFIFNCTLNASILSLISMYTFQDQTFFARIFLIDCIFCAYATSLILKERTIANWHRMIIPASLIAAGIVYKVTLSIWTTLIPYQSILTS